MSPKLISNVRFNKMINETIKIGPTTYQTSIADNPNGQELKIDVVERTRGTRHSYHTIWPYRDKEALLSDLDSFTNRSPEPVKGEWFARFASWLLRRPLVGRLGTIAEIEKQNRRIDAFLSECQGEKIFVMKDGPSNRKGNQMTFWICFPFRHLHEMKVKITEPPLTPNMGKRKKG